MTIGLVLFGPKKITFGNILTQNYRTYLPVCACAECPPGLPPLLNISDCEGQIISQNSVRDFFPVIFVILVIFSEFILSFSVIFR